MAGSQSHDHQSGRFPKALAVIFFTFAASAWAQNEPIQPTQSEDSQFFSAPGLTSDAMGVSARDCCPGTRRACSCEKGCLDTIYHSLHCNNTWRPLTLDTFFSEGWHEPWAGGPAGQCGLTPRHGWLGSFEGVFYRLGLVTGTYQKNLDKPFGGDLYSSNATAFLPLNRRFELFINAPYVVSNGTVDPARGYTTDFGDLQVAGSFLLSESKASTHLLTIGTTIPTGNSDTGGGMTTLFPRYSFWSNPRDAWVVRAGTGVNVALNDSAGQTSCTGNVAVGRYFRPHDVPLGDLVFYVNSNVVAPLEGNGTTNVGVGPGTRFQIVGDWYFLNYWEFQVADSKPFDHQMSIAIVKAW